MDAGSSNTRTIGWGVSTSPDATAKAIWVCEAIQVLVSVEIEDSLNSAVLGGSYSCPPRKADMALIAAASCRICHYPGPAILKLVPCLTHSHLQSGHYGESNAPSRPPQTGSWNTGRGQRAQMLGVPQHHPLPCSLTSNSSAPTGCAPPPQTALQRHWVSRALSFTHSTNSTGCRWPGADANMVAFLGAHLLIYLLPCRRSPWETRFEPIRSAKLGFSGEIPSNQSPAGPQMKFITFHRLGGSSIEH